MVGVVMFNGYSPVVISPPSINYQIGQMSDVTDAFAYMYSQEGHVFYVLTFPTGNATFVYDLTTQMWHERSTYSQNVYTFNRHRSNCCVTMGNITYVGDWSEPYIYKMGSSYYTDNGKPIPSMRIAPHLFDKEGLNNIFIHRLQVDLEFGIAGAEDLVVDKLGSSTYKYGNTVRKYGNVPYTSAYATLSFSDDGGRNFGAEHPASMGMIGGERKELTWRRLGYTRNGVVKLLMYTKIKKVVLGGYAEIST
jgi:hypothetical protein